MTTRPVLLKVDRNVLLSEDSHYLYNHGSNVPPGFDYQNGVLTPISYEVGDTFMYNGKLVRSPRECWTASKMRWLSRTHSTIRGGSARRKDAIREADSRS
jgi:hypothetical protein